MSWVFKNDGSPEASDYDTYYEWVEEVYPSETKENIRNKKAYDFRDTFRRLAQIIRSLRKTGSILLFRY